MYLVFIIIVTVIMIQSYSFFRLVQKLKGWYY